ncbi:tyrosine-type recombinase/integrase [Escherichia coli]
MNNVIPERVSLLPIAPGGDFATAVATSTGVTPAYLLAPEVSAPDQRHHMLFATLWNTGMRMLTPESFDLDGARPFVRVLARRGRPPKDEVRLVPLTDEMESWMVTTRPRRREPLWPMRNWLKQAVKRAEADGVHTPHTFRHSYIMHMLYHRQQALAGHRDPRSMEVYTRVFATLAVPFTGDGRDAAEILLR